MKVLFISIVIFGIFLFGFYLGILTERNVLDPYFGDKKPPLLIERLQVINKEKESEKAEKGNDSFVKDTTHSFITILKEGFKTVEQEIIENSPPIITKTFPENGAKNINSTEKVMIVWNKEVKWEEIFPKLSISPDLPENIEREIRLTQVKNEENKFQIEFLPYFPKHQKITVKVEKGVHSIFGVPSSEDFEFSFETKE